MSQIARTACRELLILRLYQRNLHERKLRDSSQKGYASHASSWIHDVAQASDIEVLTMEEEERAIYFASQGQWKRLRSLRDVNLTARLLTLTTREVCDQISNWTGKRNISTLATGLNAMGQFYHFLERERLIETNHFRHIRRRLVLTVSGFLPSLKDVRER